MTILLVIIALVSLVALLVLHEFSHFIFAKKFGVRVDEFGVGYPPRIFGKKFGETIYSLNLLPFGAFVKILGEEGGVDDPRSFSTKPYWKRAIILLAGVASFWIISAIILSFVVAMGAPIAISDNENITGLKDIKVQIAEVSNDSPAQKAGLKAGDAIVGTAGNDFGIDKVSQIQDLTSVNRGNQVTFVIQRGKDTLKVPVEIRANPPAGEGPMGVALIRTAIKSYPWYLAPFKGIEATYNITISAVEGWYIVISRAISHQPTGAQFMGPVGIVGLFTQAGGMGANYFLQMVAMISIYVALFNILPIPVTDGGKFLIITIEKIRRRVISKKITQSVESVFFILLLVLAVWVTIKDIGRIF